jgi:prolipoprotein diacylglyceryltransferase
VRFFVDFARDAQTYLGLRGTQWVSLALFLMGSAYLVRQARRGGAPETAIAGGLPTDGEPEPPETV